jgi:adenylate cyclase
VSAINVIAASVGEARKKPHALADNGIDPDWFKGKIVLIAATDKGTYDLKSTPVSKISPGTEIQATAIENMIHGQFVEPVGAWWTGGLTLAAAGVAAAGAVFPRKVAINLLGGAAAVARAVGIPLVLFRGATIRWLPPTEPLLAAGAAVVGGMAWTYLAEDRQRRFVMRALSQSLSPEVAAEIQRDPSKLHIGGERREMTVMFTDIAGFTDLSEKLDPERVAALLNFYLDSMTGILVGAAGTVDKYIGDAIMTFWNAPLTQADHAARACRAAIAMRQRESEIQGELEKRAELPTAGGEPLIYTRIGIKSGPMSVGNMGSSFKFSYTVLGDSVNLASRLESINKAYRTKVIISEMTAKLVEGQFLLRPVDVIKVKGKKKPVAIFELLSEAPGTDAQRRQAGDWDGAEKILSEILGMFPGDGPSSTLLKRIGEFRSEPPPPDWEGVYAFKEK